MRRFIAKPGTWFAEGTDAELIDILFSDASGTPVGLFAGTRVCINPESEGKMLGEEYEDEEICPFDEFDIEGEG